MLVAATDDTKLQVIQIGLAGGYVGVGAAVGVAILNEGHAGVHRLEQHDQRQGQRRGPAGIKNGEYSGRYGFGDLGAGAFHGVAVQASSSENVFGLSASVGGGFVGVAGGVAVTLIGLTTKALVGTRHVRSTATLRGTSAVAVREHRGRRHGSHADDRGWHRRRVRRRRRPASTSARST